MIAKQGQGLHYVKLQALRRCPDSAIAHQPWLTLSLTLWTDRGFALDATKQSPQLEEQASEQFGSDQDDVSNFLCSEMDLACACGSLNHRSSRYAKHHQAQLHQPHTWRRRWCRLRTPRRMSSAIQAHLSTKLRCSLAEHARHSPHIRLTQVKRK